MLSQVTQPPEDDARVIEKVIEQVRRAYDEAADAIRGMPDREAYEAATRLTLVLRDLSDAAARLRGQAVSRIWRSENLSLAALARKIGISKSRADQLLRGAARDDVQEEP
jgi:hypothetical protein